MVSKDVRERVVAASNEAGYVANVGRKSTSNIAFVHTGESSLGSPFDAALMYGMSCGMEEHGYDLLILDARRARLPGETYTQMFLRKGVRGAVLRTTLATRTVCEAIAEEGFPAVVVADRFENPKVNYIYACSRDSSREAVEHLIHLGHRRIAICINIVDDSDHADRVAGYTQALQDAGIEFDPKLVLRVPAHREPGAQALRRLRTLPDAPTAVFMTDAAAVVGLLSEARRTGVRVPEDLSIVGFDDTQMRYGLTPELTAVCQDAEALGREAFAACHLLATSAGDMPVVQKAMRTWLEVHGSTAPPGAGSTN
jgi:DNA-binding LacI/PurR family transcriptional regulator